MRSLRPIRRVRPLRRDRPYSHGSRVVISRQTLAPLTVERQSSRQMRASPAHAVMNKHAAERKPKRLPFLLARVSRTAGQRAYVCSARHRRSGVSVQLALAGRAVASTGSATEEASQSDPPADTSALPVLTRCGQRTAVRYPETSPPEPAGPSPAGLWACGLFAAALAFPDHDRDGKPVCAGDAVGWAVRSSRGSGRAGPLRGGWRRRAWRLRRRGSCGLCRGSGPRVWRFHRRGRRLPRVPGRRLRGG